MTDRSRLAASVAALFAAGTVAWAADSNTQPDARVQALESRIATLEAQQAANSKDLAATVDAVLRDAEKRSQLLANGGDMGAGYDNGFYIKAGDAWLFKPGVQFQFRNDTNYREDGKNGKDADWENGFEVRRMRFDFTGNAFSKDLTYFFQWEADRNSGTVGLLEAYAQYMFADDWGFRLGEMKDPVTHEFFASTKKQLAVETSLMDALIGGGVTGYTQGAFLIYGNYNKNTPINVIAGFTDGANQTNTDFTKRTDLTTAVPGKHTVDWGAVARAEWKVMGDWKNYADFTAKGTKEETLVLGAAGDWTQAGDGNLFVATVDGQYENPNGLGLYLAGVYNHTEADLTGFTQDNDNWGIIAQASYLINGNWEVFGRYDVTLYDNEIATATASEDTFHEITVGVNYYMGADGAAGHRAKFTVDLSYLPSGSPKAVTGAGVLDSNDFNNEWMLRAQFQLLI